MYKKANVNLSRNLRKNMTPWERKLWYNYLKPHPLRFYRQRTIGSYIADFYCSEIKLIIELDGGGHYTDEQREKDEKRTAFFKSQGIEVIRIPNNEVWDNFDGVCLAINNRIKEIQGSAR